VMPHVFIHHIFNNTIVHHFELHNFESDSCNIILCLICSLSVYVCSESLPANDLANE
jgi:hypothetical protein